MNEEWRPVVGYEEHYEVSNLGRVRSFSRFTIRAATPDKDGYPRVHLYAAPRKVKLMRVHRLVAEAFVLNPLGLPKVDHRDNDPTNPRADNLQWTTNQGNMDFMVARHRSARGEAHNKAKLTVEKVCALRVRAAEGATWRALAAEFGVTDVAARKAALGETWSHVS